MAAVIAHGSGRSYAADVVAGMGHDLTVLADAAGPLLAKDVGIVAELLPDGAHLVAAADVTLTAMDIDRHAPGDGDGEGDGDG
jgi:hypothetical protein